MDKISILVERACGVVSDLYGWFYAVSASFTQKDLIMAAFGIIAGWLITRCYSKLTEKFIQSFAPREINTAIEPVFRVVEKLEIQFNNVTKFYRNINNADLQKLSSNDTDKILKPMVDLIQGIDDELNEEEVNSLIDKSYRDEDREILKRALFFGSLLKLEGTQPSVGFKELSAYSPEMFREYIDYLLAKTLVMNSLSGRIFLLILLRNKFGLKALQMK
jgi:hypothetical protein